MAVELPEALKGLTNYPESYLATSEQDGQRWAALSDGALTGIVGMHGNASVRDACSTEMQRRLVVAIRAASDSADAQTTEVITLTRALKIYTIVLAIIGAIQIVLMLWK